MLHIQYLTEVKHLWSNNFEKLLQNESEVIRRYYII
jgi:hypothetical protein